MDFVVFGELFEAGQPFLRRIVFIFEAIEIEIVVDRSTFSFRSNHAGEECNWRAVPGVLVY